MIEALIIVSILSIVCNVVAGHYVHPAPLLIFPMQTIVVCVGFFWSSWLGAIGAFLFVNAVSIFFCVTLFKNSIARRRTYHRVS